MREIEIWIDALAPKVRRAPETKRYVMFNVSCEQFGIELDMTEEVARDSNDEVKATGWQWVCLREEA